VFALVSCFKVIAPTPCTTERPPDLLPMSPRFHSSSPSPLRLVTLTSPPRSHTRRPCTPSEACRVRHPREASCTWAQSTPQVRSPQHRHLLWRASAAAAITSPDRRHDPKMKARLGVLGASFPRRAGNWSAVCGSPVAAVSPRHPPHRRRRRQHLPPPPPKFTVTSTHHSHLTPDLPPRRRRWVRWWQRGRRLPGRHDDGPDDERIPLRGRVLRRRVWGRRLWRRRIL
jgi:hypothetical protein